MVALIMPHPETGARWKGLQHYTEHFMAPVNKSEEAARLLEELTRYKVVQPSVPPLENLTDHYVDYAFQTAEEGKWNLRLMQPPQKGFNYVNGNHREMSRLEHRLAERQSLRLPQENAETEVRHAKGIHFIAENINIIDELLAGPARGPTQRQPRWLIEASLPTKRGRARADLIMIGSDNRVRILEFGNGIYKPDKVEQQAEGLSTFYRDINGVDIPASRVITHVVQYHIEGEVNELTVFPPKLLREKLDRVHQQDNIYDHLYAYTFRHGQQAS